MSIKQSNIIKINDLEVFITSGSRGWAKYYSQSGDLFFRITNIDREEIKPKLHDCKYVSLPDKGSEGIRTRVQPGDILISITADLGTISYIDISFKQTAYINQHISLLRILNKNINNKYVAYYLASEAGKRQFHLLTDTGSKSGLNLDAIRQLKIWLPEKVSQDSIVFILSKWDCAISLTKADIATKQELRKGLIQQLLSGNQRFPEFVKSSKTIKIKYGDIPLDWDYPQIKNIATDISIKNKESKKLPVLSCTKHYGLVDSLKYFDKQIYSDNISPYKIVSRNQFVYATNHIEEGSIGYQDLYDEAVVSPMYTVFETNNKVDDTYLYLLLKTEKYRRIFEANTNASVDRRGSLRWKDFSSIHIPLPSIDEQKAIANVFVLADKEIALLQEQLDALKEQKKGLMQQLLTGKKRVKVKDVA